MASSSQLENVYGAGTGRQGYITGGGLATDLSFDSSAKLQGVALAASTTYYYRIPTAGNQTLHITLDATSVTGTPVATVYATCVDGITPKGAVTTLTTPSTTFSPCLLTNPSET